MKHLILCLGIIVSLVGYGHAQTSDDAKRSEAIVNKMRQLDLLTQIIPLALNKDQINKLLPAVERARAKVKQVQKDEASALQKMEAKINDAIKKSEETCVAPPKALLEEIAETTANLSQKRLLAIDENTDTVFKVFNETLNAGQKKAAANSLSPQLFDPSLKPDKMTDTDKIKFFVREIFLDPQTYDVLIEIQKHTSD